MKTERNSSFELLRLLCIFGITVMHAFANIDTGGSWLNTEAHILFNSVFNTGVTCFILISGYFGIHFKLEKLVRMDCMVIFFTLAGTILLGDFGIKSLIKSCIPVISRRYWFITCYFALCILAPFLNQIPERLERAKFRSLLLVLLLLFSVIPTLTTYDIMQDAGKGLVHFVMVYLIGRYLARYQNRQHSGKILAFGFFCCILAIFLLDSGLTFLHRGEIYSTFARDCSLLIILAAVLLLLLFGTIKFTSPLVNRIASNVLAVTVLDSVLMNLLNRRFSLNAHSHSIFLTCLVLGYALIVVIIAIVSNEIRKFTIGRIEPWLCDFIVKFWNQIQALTLRLTDRIAAAFLQEKR